ncbi:MAG TPA: MBL fold metallo-hydrolase [Chthoniobacterales bacterium]|nr:MBL fold metallo-hydrolase [Chthoniobacterales bacterium]
MSQELKEKEFHAGKTGVYRFQRDGWDGWVLHDFTLPPQPIRQYAIGAADEEIRELTQSNFVDGDQIQLSANPLLIRRNDQFILVDTGMGKQRDGANGLLLHHLSQLGIEREQITFILLTHLHIDHVAGAFTGEESLFPNAKVFISETEIGFWTQPDPDTSELRDVPLELINLTFEIARNGVRTLERQTISFKPDEEIIPGVTTLALPGHTPGHSGFLFQFGDEPFIAAGDFAHDPLLQLTRPDRTIVGDAHRATTVRTRKKLLKRLAENRIRFHAYHFPFPSVGHVRTTDHQSYEFVPERWVWR